MRAKNLSAPSSSPKEIKTMARDIDIRARKSGTRNLKKLILIVCEGARTEPAYFEAFPLSKQVREIVGAGANTVSVVKEAIALRAQRAYDEVWCVFDRDSFKIDRVNAAFELARKEGIMIAFSNESFELWYLLHFQYLDTAISRTDYCRKLGEKLGGYRKNDNSMYKRLLSLQPTAIKNAKNLLRRVRPADIPVTAPVTTVHILVERLNKLIATNH